MNTVIYSVTLKLDEIDDADNTVVMMQSDNLTRIIRAMFYDKDTIEAIDKTAVVQLVIARPDNKVLWVDCHGIDSDEQLDYYNTIESVITADMISVPGNGMGQFLIWNSAKTEVIRSQKFRIKIGQKLDNLDAQEGDPAYGALQEMLDRAVEKYMASNPNIPTKEELSELVNKYFEENPVTGVTPEMISSAVESYLTEHPVQGGHTDAQINQLIQAYLTAHPVVGEKGDKGDSYTITQSDYTAIANVVLGLIQNGDELAYGN